MADVVLEATLEDMSVRVGATKDVVSSAHGTRRRSGGSSRSATSGGHLLDPDRPSDVVDAEPTGAGEPIADEADFPSPPGVDPDPTVLREVG
jgi:hypothetical protein